MDCVRIQPRFQLLTGNPSQTLSTLTKLSGQTPFNLSPSRNFEKCAQTEQAANPFVLQPPLHKRFALLQPGKMDHVRFSHQVEGDWTNHVDVENIPRDAKSIFPKSTPVFMVHGTWDYPHSAKEWQQWYENNGNTPTYRSYIEKLCKGGHFLSQQQSYWQKIRGIQVPDTPIPVIVGQDFGQFLFQVATLNTRELVKGLHTEEQKTSQSLLQRLQLLPELSALLPQLKPQLIQLLETPGQLSALPKEASFQSFLESGYEAVQAEATLMLDRFNHHQHHHAEAAGAEEKIERLPYFETPHVPAIVDSAWFITLAKLNDRSSEELYKLPNCALDGVDLDWRIPEHIEARPDNPFKHQAPYIPGLERVERVEEELQPTTSNTLPTKAEKKAAEKESTIKITPRVLNSKTLGQFNAALDELETKLTQYLIQPCRQLKITPANQSYDEFFETYAHSVAQACIQQIAPDALGVGHSGGGTALFYGLLNQLENVTGTEQPDNPTLYNGPYGREYLSSFKRLGTTLMASSPIAGIPDKPAWAAPLLDKVPIVLGQEWLQGALQAGLTLTVWTGYKAKSPIARYYKADSVLAHTLTQKAQVLSNREHHQHHTIFALANKNDGFIEPEATRVPESAGHLPSVNFLVEDVPMGPLLSKEVMARQHLARFAPQSFIDWLLDPKNEARADQAYEIYKKYLRTSTEHGTIFRHPEYLVSDGVIHHLLKTQPETLRDFLHTDNADMFRTGVMQAFQHEFMAAQSDPVQALDTLERLNVMLDSVITAANDIGVTTTAPSQAARALLRTWIQTIGQCFESSKTYTATNADKPQTRDFLCDQLRRMERTHPDRLPRDAGHITIAQQARQLEEKLSCQPSAPILQLLA